MVAGGSWMKSITDRIGPWRASLRTYSYLVVTCVISLEVNYASDWINQDSGQLDRQIESLTQQREISLLIGSCLSERKDCLLVICVLVSMCMSSLVSSVSEVNSAMNHFVTGGKV